MSVKEEECTYVAIKGLMGIKIVKREEVGNKEILFYMPESDYNRYKDKQTTKQEKSEIELYCKGKFPAKVPKLEKPTNQ